MLKHTRQPDMKRGYRIYSILQHRHDRIYLAIAAVSFCRRQHPYVSVRYPTELNDLPKYASWLTARVKSSRNSGAHVDDDVVQYGQPPERYAISHRKMYAFGMHFRCRSAEGGLVTCDSCVVGTFTMQMPWGLRNGQPMEHTDEYVGYIDEIFGVGLPKPLHNRSRMRLGSTKP